jgi:hypothetical protein
MLRIASLLAFACICMQACSSPPAKRIAECLIGPDPKQDPVCDGEIVPWGTVEFPGADPTRYVCHKLDDHEAYRARCQP